MKPLRFSLLLVLVALTIVSCKKVPVINYNSSNISFKIEGAAKQSKGDKNVFSIYSEDYKIMQIVGNLDETGDHQIALMLNNFHGVGEYTVGQDDFLAIYTTPEIEQSVSSIDGTIKITEYIAGKSIKGEFQFKGEVMVFSTDPNHVPEYKNFTEGKFEAKVIEDDLLDI